MVVSRSDIKRRQKDGEGGLQESPKRTKVHAQRKFAQGSNLNTPTLTPVKDKDKSKVNGTVVPTELLPAKRPNTEDFLTFLCFRGTRILPSKLDFFNVAATPEQHDEDSKADHSVAGSSRVSTRVIEKSFSEQSFAVAKAETKTRNKPRPTAAVQAFKKKYQEQRLAKQKISLTKLAQKVKGKNMVRTRSAALLEENRRGTKTVTQPSHAVARPVKAKISQKGLIKKSIKRLVPKQISSSLRGGLRSGGELPPGSDVGLKTERKPRLIVKNRERPSKPSKRLKVQTSKTIASSLSDFSSDDDQPLVKKQRINLRRQRFQSNTSITTRSNQLGRLRRNRIEVTNNSVSSRPSRKTKEAAALFMEEMIGKDLKNPDEDSDYNDEIFSKPSTSKKTDRKEKEVKNTLEKSNEAKVLPKDHTKRDNSSLEKNSSKRKKEEEDKKLLKKTVVKLNIIKEKDTKTIKKLSFDKDAGNKLTTSKFITKEEKVVEFHNRIKSETKVKTLPNRSDRRHSLPETAKVIVVKRTTRQRPGNLSLDSSPSRLKMQLNEIDDKFSDSDEEPLGNISGPNSITPKQLNASKSSADRNLIPLLRKEPSSVSKITAKKNDSKKVEDKKLSEKQNRIDDVKNKPVPKKETIRKSLSEEDISTEEKFQARNEMRSKFRKTKSIEDLDMEVKHSNINKGNKKSSSIETKSQAVKKIETISNKVGNTKAVEISTEIAQKPKLKKGWAFCDDIQDSTSNTNITHSKDTKAVTLNKAIIETVPKKESCIKLPLLVEETLKSNEIESVQSTLETSIKKSNKKNSTNISKNSLVPESISDDISKKSTQKVSTKPPTHFNTNKNKQTNKKSNLTNIIENTLLIENKNKYTSHKSNVKGCTNSATSNIKTPSGKNSQKNNPENLFSESKISDPPSVSVKLLNDSIKKNLKSKTLSSNQNDTSLHNKKSNKHKDSEFVCESGKSLCKSKVESCEREINQSTVPDCSTSCKISKNENENNYYNNNQDNSPSLYKSTVKIEDSNCNIKLKKEMNKDGSNDNLSDCKNNTNIINKNKKVLTIKPSVIDSQEIKTSKKKKSSQKVQDRVESLSIRNKEDFIVKGQEKSNPIGSANYASTSNKPSIKFNTKNNKSIILKVPDNDDRSDAKKEEKALPIIEGSQVSNVKTISKVCLEPDKNKIVINIERNICTGTIDSSCTKKVLEVDKNKGNKKQNKRNCEVAANPIIQEIEDDDDDIKKMSDNTLGFTRQDTNTLKLPSKILVGNLVNNNNFEIDNLKDTENSVMKMVSNKNVHKEQPTALKYIQPGSFNRGIENPPLPLLQTPKLNVELVDYKSFDQMEPVSQNLNQPENLTDINNMQLYHVNLNRVIPQQRPEALYKLDQVSTSGGSKSDHFSNDRCLLKEGIRPNSDTRILDNIDTKDKLLNLDQSKNMKVSEKMKNETVFGSTKEIKNVTINEPKLKIDMPLPGFQLLKSSAKAKSMLKPGTLIDIAGGINVGLQSDSITNFMRPPLDNAMTKALKTDFFPPDSSLVQSSAPVITTKIEVKTEPFSFGTNKSSKDEFGSKPDLINAIRKERLESSVSNKIKTSVNDTWRQAFKNVKIPKPGTSNISINSDKPVVRKPLSVTALAKKHTLAKSDSPSPDKSTTQPSIPFLRQSKPFLGGSHQSQTNKSKMSDDHTKIKLNEEIDMNNLRKKEAEVEEIVRRYVAGEFAKSSTDIESTSGTNEPPIVQTEINMNSSSILNISHQREDSVSKYRSGNDSIAIKRTSSPITNISQLKEDKGDRNIPGNEITRSNSPFAIQIKREGNDNLEAVSSLGPISIQHKEDLNSTFSGSIFSGKDRTPSPSSLSRNYIGNVEEHSPRHIPIPNLPVFSKSVHSNASPNFSEAKHQHLPLPVEQTLKKLSLAKLPMNKKLVPVGNNQPKSQEIRDVANPVPKPEESIQHLPKSASEPNTKCHDQTAVSFDFNRANISSHCLNKETSPLNVDLMAKKKVNMTTEEIKKWLSDSTSVGIEHKQNCGIFDKNHCECGYKTIPSNPSSENIQENQTHHTIKDEVNIDKIIVEPVAEIVLISESQHSKCIDNLTNVSVSKTIKNEDMSLNSTLKPSVNTIEMIEVNNKLLKNITKQISSPVVQKQDVLITNVKVENNNSSVDQLKKTIHLKSDTEEQIITNPLILSIKSEDLSVIFKSDNNKSEELSIENNTPSVKGCVNTNCIKKNKAYENLKMDLKLKSRSVKSLKLLEPSAKNKTTLDNEVFESNTDVPTSPVAIRPKLGRPTNHRPGDSEAELSSRDPSEVSSPPPRDDVSSSNDDSPDKFVHPERRSIFHQRRSVMKVKEQRKETLLSPSTSAFSPDNESSVYAFDPDLPPTSNTPPFRRCKKDGRTSSTATDDDESTPSSASIAVQVNLDNEAVLECSTQTEMQEADDDDGSEGHLFYIPLQQSHKDAATTQEMIQGVTVKLGTEGPDQRVTMRAKLVTKPPSAFNRQPSTSAARALMPSSQISRSGKPEQKVRPLSVKPPVGTVTPTTRASPSRNTVQPAVSIQTSPKPDHFETDEKNNTPGPSKAASIETEIKPIKTKSPYRTIYTAGKTSKRGKGRQSQVTTASVCSEFPAASDPAKLVEAPTFYPNDKEFQDPLEYIDSIRPLAEKFGLCRVVPPSDFKPECKVSDDMRFTAYNQYIHKMLHRWGPNVKEMMAIRKYLATQSIALTQPPWVGGMEVDLPRLYQTVQVCGGLKEVIEKKRWYRVADAMKIPKSAQDRVTKLDDIYCKFLLPYDTLSHEERTKLFEEVENDWVEREKRVNNTTDSDSEDNDSDDIDECIVKGRIMALNGFYRIARNTMSMWFSKTEQPGASEVEAEFWRHVGSRQCHVCVHSGSIDSGSVGYGFPVAKNSSTSRHPWNLKVLTNNPGSILRSLGPLMGVTVPTLHVGMLFSTCCWYRDPHGLPWIEYLHTGASKIWYGIPDSSSSVFRDAATKLVPRLCRDKTIWLASDTAMVPPPLLVERGVSLCRVVQEPGQFIIVFPKAFTSSICTGYLVSESVYFAQSSWLASAQQIFDDIRESCEPSMFSLEKLLFSIAIDTRTPVDVLNQILPMMLNIRDEEIARRKQLEEIGLSNSERLPVNKRRKTRPTNDEEADYECDICRANLFLSLVTNTHEEGVYCLSHAIEVLSKKRSQLKHCNFLYTYSKVELNDLVDKLKSRIETKSQKKLQGKSVQANKS